MTSSPPAQCLVTLDVEGVLTPEIWIALADEFGIEGLRRTTKDEADYELLMAGRIAALREHDITIDRIQKVIADLRPLEGSCEFLAELRADIQVVLLSDTFEEFIGPLMAQMGHPTILCHRLHIEAGHIAGFTPRVHEQKKRAVEAFRAMNYRVIAAGDSHNDLGMIDAADTGFLFKAPGPIREQRSDLDAYETFDQLFAAIRTARAGLEAAG